jgi:hypothetical protein
MRVATKSEMLYSAPIIYHTCRADALVEYNATMAYFKCIMCGVKWSLDWIRNASQDDIESRFYVKDSPDQKNYKIVEIVDRHIRYTKLVKSEDVGNIPILDWLKVNL